jgi:hypothetical protein
VDGTLNEQATGSGVGSGVGGGAGAGKAMSNDIENEIASSMQEIPEDARTLAAAVSLFSQITRQPTRGFLV